MKRTTNISDSQPDAQLLEITEQVSLAQLSALQRAKNKRLVVLGEVPVKDLAKLNAHWYESVSIALSVDPQSKVLKVHVVAKQADQFVYPKAGVQRRQGKRVKPCFTTLDGLPVYYPADLVRAERR